MREKWSFYSGLGVVTVGLALAAAFPAWSQSITTDGNIETAGQLVSAVERGTAPLAVSSTTVVLNLNADQLDGRHSTSFALASELLAAIAALDNPDPPCFNTTQRFVDCDNGTVTDTVTGLIYLKDANCFGQQAWPTANGSAAALADGSCGLTDGSRPGDWRLMKKAEWEGIVNADCLTDPEIVGNGSPPDCYSDNPWATNVVVSGGAVSSYYWSSTTNAFGPSSAWYADLGSGAFSVFVKTNTIHLWPVRGGQ